MKSLFPILLCLLLLPLTACQPDFSGSRMGTPRGLHMSYTAFHTTEKQTLSLKAGEEIALSLVSQAGTLSITIWKGEEEPIYEGEGLTTQDFTVEVEEAGTLHRGRHRPGRGGQRRYHRGPGPFCPGDMRRTGGRNFCKPPKFDGKNGGNP